MLMTENRERRQKRGTGEMKPFGRLLNRMMVDREMYEWKDLVAAMKAQGYKIEGSKLSQYLYGGRHPRDPEEFFGVVAKALNLSEAEKKELMFAYGFPDSFTGARMQPERVEKISDAEERLRRRAEGEEDEQVNSGEGIQEDDEGPTTGS